MTKAVGRAARIEAKKGANGLESFGEMTQFDT
jgi:hypothetical protein